MANIHDNRDKEVTVIQQGVLTPATDTIATPIVGANTTDFTVPTGKKWKVLDIRLTESGFTGTHNQKMIWVVIGGVAYTLYSKSGADATYQHQCGEQGMILKAGDIIRPKSNLSAYTSGSIVHELLYIEMDA